MECSLECKVWRVWSVQRVKCRVWSVECGGRSVKCKVWRVKCGVESVKRGE